MSAWNGPGSLPRTPTVVTAGLRPGPPLVNGARSAGGGADFTAAWNFDTSDFGPDQMKIVDLPGGSFASRRPAVSSIGRPATSIAVSPVSTGFSSTSIGIGPAALETLNVREKMPVATSYAGSSRISASPTVYESTVFSPWR